MPSEGWSLGHQDLELKAGLMVSDLPTHGTWDLGGFATHDSQNGEKQGPGRVPGEGQTLADPPEESGEERRGPWERWTVCIREDALTGTRASVGGWRCGLQFPKGGPEVAAPSTPPSPQGKTGRPRTGSVRTAERIP